MAKLSMSSRFRRYPSDGYVAGVCAGIAVYLDWNVKLIRALAVLTLIFGGGFPILLVYGVLWYVMDPDDAPAQGAETASYRSHYTATGGTAQPAGYPASARDLKARFSRMEERLRSMEECVTSNDYDLRRELRKLES